MSNPKTFAKTAANALRSYAGRIDTSYWDQPDPADPRGGHVELPAPYAEDMTTALPIIADFLESMFEEEGAE